MTGYPRNTSSPSLEWWQLHYDSLQGSALLPLRPGHPESRSCHFHSVVLLIWSARALLLGVILQFYLQTFATRPRKLKGAKVI